MQAMYCCSQVSIFQQPVYWDLFSLYLLGLLEMSATHSHLYTHTCTAGIVPLSVRPIQAVIRDSTARTSHKPAFMVRLLSFRLQLW